MQEDYIT